MTEERGIGDNTGAEQLKRFVARIQNLNETRAEIAADIKEVYAEAKSAGFDTKMIRKVVSLMTREPHVVAEEFALLHTYCRNLDVNIFS